ncbi:GNAT family N-acetyltransferase [Croceivirga radicis]|nr:GNAT family N-acetyltransferase [Croceivirga radicis]
MKTEIHIKPIHYTKTWPIRHSVMWPNQSIEFIKLEKDAEGSHLGLFVGEHLTSIISLFQTQEGVQFRKFATLTEAQGKGYGTQLLTEVFKRYSNGSVSRIWCNARVEKAKYYERFGLQRTNKTYRKGGIAFVVMEKLFCS